MAQTVNITNKTAREISSYVWEYLPCSINSANAVKKIMFYERKSLKDADTELFFLIHDLMSEYCEKHNLELDKVIKSGYDEQWVFNSMFDLENNP